MTPGAAPTNRLVIRAFGLQRSGNHALIEWVLQQYAGDVTALLNNVQHGMSDPYETCAQRVVHGMDPTLSTEEIRATPKSLLIYSYEDSRNRMDETRDFLDSVRDPAADPVEDRFLGGSERSLKLLIIRDPFNFFASRLKRLEKLTGRRDVLQIARDWKQLAVRALQLASNDPGDELVGNYNRWVQDREYRVWLGAQVGGVFSDESMHRVSRFGGGSSFEPRVAPLSVGEIARKWRKIFNISRYKEIRHYLERLRAPTPTKMKVTERWLHSRDDTNFRRVFSDPEMLELSEQLFGPLDGTREFCASLR